MKADVRCQMSEQTLQGLTWRRHVGPFLIYVFVEKQNRLRIPALLLTDTCQADVCTPTVGMFCL